MARNITVHFSDGTAHQYNNAPDDFTPDQVEARTKRDYPNKKIVKIDGGKKSTQASELDQVKKNAGVNQSKDLSQFNIKGLRFGMTVEEVVAITKAKVDDNDAYYTALRAAKAGQYINRYSGEFKKPATSTYDALNGFSIGGSIGWTPTFENDKLVSIIKTIDPNSVETWFDNLVSQSGKPRSISEPIVSNKMGYKDTNFKAYWTNKDAEIALYKYLSTFNEGAIVFRWSKHLDQQINKSRQDLEKAKKDFE